MWFDADAMGIAVSERRLKFPPKLGRHIYTDIEIAEALKLLSEINNDQRVSEKTGVPCSTPNWHRRFRLILP